MTELLTSAQMRGIETAAMEAGQVSGLTLMERAGQGVVAALGAAGVLAQPGRAAVLAGPGNNGGDGYVIARLLQELGWSVDVLALGDPDRLPADARTNAERWRRDHPVRTIEAAAGPPPDLLVDAVFGTGLTRAIPETVARAVTVLRGPATFVVAVDCPSGLDADSGRRLWPEGAAEGPRADLTVTFHMAKCGHYLADGPDLCGRIVVADIGLGAFTPASADPFAGPSPDRLRLVAGTADWPAALIGPPAAGAHKYDRGHVLVLAGGVGRGGAGRLAARAALRTGAGLVTLACPPAAMIENAARLDAVMLRPLADAEGLAGMLEDRRLTALCLGPGLGVGPRTRDLVEVALDAGRRVVLDADALTVLAGDPAQMLRRCHSDVVLTPHSGEFARLFPDLADAVRDGGSRAEAARAAADWAGCVVLLKGRDTIVASPGGAASVHAAAYERTARWLGTAGSGDVLAGIVAGLLATPGRGPVHVLAEAAAWLHAEAGRAVGPGMIAEDLPEALPGVFRALGL